MLKRLFSSAATTATRRSTAQKSTSGKPSLDAASRRILLLKTGKIARKPRAGDADSSVLARELIEKPLSQEHASRSSSLLVSTDKSRSLNAQLRGVMSEGPDAVSRVLGKISQDEWSPAARALWVDSCGSDVQLALVIADKALEGVALSDIAARCAVSTSVIQVCIRAGDFEKAKTVFRDLERTGLAMDLPLYTAFVAGAIQTDHFDDAWQVFDEMRKFTRNQPDQAMFSLLIHACAREYPKALASSGLVERAFSLFSEMRSMHGYLPNEITLNTLMLAAAKSEKYCTKAFELFFQNFDLEHMRTMGVSEPSVLRAKINVFTLHALLTACATAGDLKAALLVWNAMKTYVPERDLASFPATLSTLLRCCSRFALKIRGVETGDIPSTSFARAYLSVNLNSYYPKLASMYTEFRSGDPATAKAGYRTLPLHLRELNEPSAQSASELEEFPAVDIDEKGVITYKDAEQVQEALVAPAGPAVADLLREVKTCAHQLVTDMTLPPFSVGKSLSVVNSLLDAELSCSIPQVSPVSNTESLPVETPSVLFRRLFAEAHMSPTLVSYTILLKHLARAGMPAEIENVLDEMDSMRISLDFVACRILFEFKAFREGNFPAAVYFFKLFHPDAKHDVSKVPLFEVVNYLMETRMRDGRLFSHWSKQLRQCTAVEPEQKKALEALVKSTSTIAAAARRQLGNYR
ncbi:mitochondrial pentatricopeptide repeat (PPR) protein [Andalucia godoyi]|uniref:Mitochondrial pentatricopeptide repeat (PPR) protein n=1 Tax=Andalucia godoyi TaxID=505711 RepID=A0A8K0AI71_ANDGO|nr:mitochondrial pentatricopeptide repeat (PPR) protein [Andalucia godoyi]|eukprot:ANDGO_05038.mRNA.1 mitochondrial pentatricopeptide repeat (PPR) protein